MMRRVFDADIMNSDVTQMIFTETLYTRPPGISYFVLRYRQGRRFSPATAKAADVYARGTRYRILLFYGICLSRSDVSLQDRI